MRPVQPATMPAMRVPAIIRAASRHLVTAAAAGLLAMAGQAQARDAPAQEPEPQGLRPLKEHCLAIADIRAGRVLDDERILLHLADGRVVLMRLKRVCPQLLFHRSFRFAGEMGQICAELDRIVTRAGLRCSIAGFALWPCGGRAPEDRFCAPPEGSGDLAGTLPDDEEEGP